MDPINAVAEQMEMDSKSDENILKKKRVARMRAILNLSAAVEYVEIGILDREAFIVDTYSHEQQTKILRYSVIPIPHSPAL